MMLENDDAIKSSSPRKYPPQNMMNGSPRKKSPHKNFENPWVRAARDLERLKERSLSTGSATTDASALDTPRTPFDSPRETFQEMETIEEDVNVDFFEHMNILELTEEEKELMKKAYEAGEKYFDKSLEKEKEKEEDTKNVKYSKAMKSLRVTEALKSFLNNDESTLGSRVTSRNVHVKELDFHVQKSRTGCLDPIQLRSGSKIVGFYGALTGSYKEFRSHEEMLRSAAEMSKKRSENGEPDPYDYLLDTTYMVRCVRAR